MQSMLCLYTPNTNFNALLLQLMFLHCARNLFEKQEVKIVILSGNLKKIIILEFFLTFFAIHP